MRSSVSNQIRAGLPPRSNALNGQPNRGDEISSGDQLRHGALVVGRIAPIYGKLTLASELAAEPGLIVVCGRYEGVDDRVRQALGAREVSIGSYVLSGGELPAMVLIDAADLWFR